MRANSGKITDLGHFEEVLSPAFLLFVMVSTQICSRLFFAEQYSSSQIEASGVEILHKEEKILSKEEAAEFYKQHEGSEHFEELIEYMSRLVAILFLFFHFCPTFKKLCKFNVNQKLYGLSA